MFAEEEKSAIERSAPPHTHTHTTIQTQPYKYTTTHMHPGRRRDLSPVSDQKYETSIKLKYGNYHFLFLINADTWR